MPLFILLLLKVFYFTFFFSLYCLQLFADDYVFYLDPHVVQPTVNTNDEFPIDVHFHFPLSFFIC